MKKKNYKLLVEGWRNFINEEHSGDDLFDSDHHSDVEVEDVVTDQAIVDTEERLITDEERKKQEERAKYLKDFCDSVGINCDDEAIKEFIIKNQVLDVEH